MAYYTIPVHVFKKANIGLGTNDPIGTFAPELCRFGVLTHTAHLGYKCHACAGYRGGRGVYRLAAVIAEVIPHPLNPVATYMFGVLSEYGPIYGIPSKLTQSSTSQCSRSIASG